MSPCFAYVQNNFFCSPDRVHNAESTTNERRLAANSRSDYHDRVDMRSDSFRRPAYGNDDRSGSYAWSEPNSPFSSAYIPCDGSTAVGENDDHRRRSSFAVDQNNGNQKDSLQDRYDKNISYRNYHREDLSYYGTEADTSCYQPSTYPCAGGDLNDNVSQITEPFHNRSYRNRDSPFVRRLKNKRYDDDCGDNDDDSYR